MASEDWTVSATKMNAEFDPLKLITKIGVTHMDTKYTEL